MIKLDKNPAVHNIFIKYGFIWQSILLVILASIIWRIYYPGIMSPDSIEQYGQALKGEFVDWHPPLMSLILAAVLKLGGTIGTLTLIQSLTALFGLRSAVSLLLRLFSGGGISKSSSKFIATIFTVIFLVPFMTPFMFISVIFWKDAWLAIIMLWIVSYLAWLFLNLEFLTKQKLVIHILLLSAASAAIILVRHNAILMIPVISLMIIVLIAKKLNRIWYLMGAAPLVLTFSLNPIVDYVFDVQHVKAGNLVVATDLTTMVRLFPELEPEYPATIRHRNTPRPNPKDLIIELGQENAELQDEYLKTFSAHPVKLLLAKLHRFGQMLNVENALRQKIAYDVITNEYGLKTNEDYSELRYKLNDLSSKTENKWYFIWFSGLHVVWLVMNILAAGYYFMTMIKQKDKKSFFLFFLFLLPLSYFASYLLSATTPDYRFMYPATLLTQINIISLFLSKLSFLKTESHLKHFRNKKNWSTGNVC